MHCHRVGQYRVIYEIAGRVIKKNAPGHSALPAKLIACHGEAVSLFLCASAARPYMIASLSVSRYLSASDVMLLNCDGVYSFVPCHSRVTITSDPRSSMYVGFCEQRSSLLKCGKMDCFDFDHRSLADHMTCLDGVILIILSL